MDHRQEITTQPRELNPQMRIALFENLQDELKITLFDQKNAELFSLGVNRSMLSKKLCKQNLQRDSWKIETTLNERKFLMQGLKKFIQYLASGFLKTHEENIWRYIVLATAFRSDSFISTAMKQRLKVVQSRDLDVLDGILDGEQLQFLLTVRFNGVSFPMWLTQNNPEHFEILFLQSEVSNFTVTAERPEVPKPLSTSLEELEKQASEATTQLAYDFGGLKKQHPPPKKRIIRIWPQNSPETSTSTQPQSNTPTIRLKNKQISIITPIINPRQPRIQLPPINRYVHDSDQCNQSRRVKLECGHIICQPCMISRYFNRTVAFEDIGKPLDYSKAKRYNVNCWNCNVNLTKQDIAFVNAGEQQRSRA